MRRFFDGRSRLEVPAPWKVKREFWRIVRQIDDFTFRYLNTSFPILYLKHVIDKRVITKTGKLALGNRVAIYLIFPSDGLLKSHLIALDYIIHCGYAPLVVSNLPLKPEEQDEILQRSGALILRPNFGYDFGGYRDAIRFLEPRLSQLDHLAILNDSSWFPLQPTLNWFEEAEAKNCDFVGSAEHWSMDPFRDWNFERDDWAPSKFNPEYHYCSFSLLIGSKILQSKDFLRFWQSFRATNYKPLTIKRGEIGLTQWVLAHGFSSTATCSIENLDSELAGLTTERLLEIASNIIVPLSSPINQARRDLIAVSPPNRTDLIAFILRSTAKQGSGYALVDYDAQERSGNFIKKSPAVLDPVSAEQTLRILEKFKNPEAAVFLQEAHENIRKKRGTKTPV